MKTFLHIGCGPKHKDQTTRSARSEDAMRALAQAHFPQ